MRIFDRTVIAAGARIARRAAILALLAACTTPGLAPQGENPPGENPPGENPPGENPPPGAQIDTIFYDGFEGGTLAAWDDGVDPTHQRIVTDASLAHAGSRLLEVTYKAGGTGGWLSRFFMPGYDAVYVSYRFRFEPDWESGTKLLNLRGSRTDNQWSSFGNAGKCPTGSDFFAANVITQGNGDPGPLRFYSYYPGMATEPDGVTCWGRWGPESAYLDLVAPSLGAWHHLEFWVNLNTPGSSNGEQRFWLDGELLGEWTGLAFRTSDILRLNSLTLESSNAGPPPSKDQHLYIDDVLVATARPES